jgi:hypothetical protein
MRNAYDEVLATALKACRHALQLAAPPASFAPYCCAITGRGAERNTAKDDASQRGFC